MTARTRPDLAAIPDYVAGRSVPGAVKLASNEVTDPPLPSVVAAVAAAAAQGNRYPDPAATALVGALAARLGVDPARVAVGCGSVSLCQQVVQVTCAAGDEVVFAWRSFESYPIVTRVAGAVPVPVALTADAEHDLDAMLAAITPRTRLVFVCNPNNPTSTVVDPGRLAAFLDAVPEGVLVVLDEAYVEYERGPRAVDGVALAATRPHVAVLRTFSKAYGLAGIRVGYCVADPAITTALRKVAVPFAVSSLAQAAALACLDAADELLARTDAVAAQRDRLRDELRAMGHDVPESQTNFVWLPLGADALPFAEHCAEHGLIVRAFAGDGVRISTGTPEHDAALLAAARAFAGAGVTA